MNSLSQNSLRRKIMRRVWYSFAIRRVFSLTTLKGFALAVSAGIFVQIVSVTSLVNNLLSVQVKAVPEYVWSTLVASATSGEFLKLITLGVIVFTLLSFRPRISAPAWRESEVQHI
jgi:hypothetical protein